MNSLIEYTVPHNGSINACSGEILTLETYSIMHQSFETLGHNPPPPPIRLGDERRNAGPLASYLLHFRSLVSAGCAVNPGLHLPDRGISGAVTLWSAVFIFALHSDITLKTAISLQMMSINISYITRHISCYFWINSVFL